LDTLSDLIFAMKGEFFAVQCRDELSRAKSNRGSPGWLLENIEKHKWETIVVSNNPQSSNRLCRSVGGGQSIYSVRSSSEEHSYGKYRVTTRSEETPEVA
jgi:hypothetical protein